MTGKQIRKLSQQLDLDAFALAGVLGVHVSTIYRWEAAHADVKMDPLQAQIMERLRAHVAAKPQAAADTRDAIIKGLVTGGALLGLLALLKQLFEDDP